MSWYPSGLPGPVVALATAIDRRFQPKVPSGPLRLPSYTTTELQTLVPTNYAVAINSTAKKLVIAVPNAGATAFEWVYFDGSAI